MSRIIPFRAVRPPRDKANLVASRSYVSYKPKALKRKLTENPYTFIHIINPEFGTEERSEPNSSERFYKVKKKYEEFLKQGYLEKDSEDTFYVYRQTTPRNSFTGLICGVAVEEYLNGQIKIHEHTLTSRVEVFTRYLDICDFNAEPVLLTYDHVKVDLNRLLAEICSERPEYEFTTTDRNLHEMWNIREPELIERIQQEFESLDCMYIADGHHRMASSAHLAEIRRSRPNFTPNSPGNFALAMLIPNDNLNIEPFHRLINMGEPLNEENFLNDLKKHFKVEACGSCYLPSRPRTCGMRLKSGWYSLELIDDIQSDQVSDHLDAVILAKRILEPILGIKDQKTDPRISFIPGNQPLKSFEKEIMEGAQHALFTLFPVSHEQLFAVAEAGEIMPPKSTYIEPKLRSGLTIMPLS